MPARCTRAARPPAASPGGTPPTAPTARYAAPGTRSPDGTGTAAPAPGRPAPSSARNCAARATVPLRPVQPGPSDPVDRLHPGAYLDQLPHYGLGYLPPPVTALLLIAWGHLHGLVALEVFRHTSFLGDHHTEIFRTVMRNLLEDIHRRIAVAPAPRP
ncbi:WHG domain-containing protein [Streptomyces sp. NBC_01363]|nr:WHG domain-containing protein [Streptomyces sp. NBC_01363]